MSVSDDAWAASSETAPSRRSRVNWTWRILFVVVLAAGLVIRLTNMHPVVRSPDEKVYMSYAASGKGGGPSAIAHLVEKFNNTQDDWIYPPPTRVGNILLVAGVSKMTGLKVELVAPWVSCVFSLVTLVFIAVLGLRYLGRWATLAALAFFIVSPFDLTLAVRAWQDSIIEGLGIVVLFFCLEAAFGQRPARWQVAFFVASFFFLLVKEAAVVIYGCCAACLVLCAFFRGNDKRWKASSIALMLACILVPLLSFGTIVWLGGGLTPVFQVYRNMNRGLAVNHYAWLYQSGPWYSLPLGFWVLSPLSTLLCFVGIGYALFNRDSDDELLKSLSRRVVLAMAGFVLVIMVIASVPDGFKCLRYVSVLEGPMKLLAGLALVWFYLAVARRFRPRGRTILAALLSVGLLASCVADFQRYQRIFVRGDLNDLAISGVLDAAFNRSVSVAMIRGPILPNDRVAAVHLSRSHELYQKGAYLESISEAQRALQTKPDYADAWNNIGAAYNQLGRFSEGMEACQKALTLDPGSKLAWGNLQYAQQKLNEQPK